MVIHLSWEDIEELVARLVADLPRDYDLLLVVTRGGMVPACLISEQTDIRNIVAAAVMFYTGRRRDAARSVFLQFPADPLLYGKRILIVDDVWDTGRTIVAVKQRIVAAGGEADLAVLHYKPGPLQVRDPPGLLRRDDRRLDRLPVGPGPGQAAGRRECLEAGPGDKRAVGYPVIPPSRSDAQDLVGTR